MRNIIFIFYLLTALTSFGQDTLEVNTTAPKVEVDNFQIDNDIIDLFEERVSLKAIIGCNNENCGTLSNGVLYFQISLIDGILTDFNVIVDAIESNYIVDLVKGELKLTFDTKNSLDTFTTNIMMIFNDDGILLFCEEIPPRIPQ